MSDRHEEDTPGAVSVLAKKEKPASFAAALEPLSETQRRFVEAFLDDPCKTRAARAAGYSASCAGVMGNRLMKDYRVRHAIDLWREENRELLAFDRTKYLHQLETMTYATVLDFKFTPDGEPVVEEGKEHLWAAVQDVKRRVTTTRAGETVVEVTVKLANKVDAARLLGAANGVFDEAVSYDERPAVIVQGIDLASLLVPRQKQQQRQPPALPAPREDAGG